MLAVAHPHVRHRARVVRDPIGRNRAAVGDAPGEHGGRGLHDVGLKHRMDTVGRDHQIGLCTATVGELHNGAIAVLPESDRSFTRGHGALRETVGKHGDEVGPVHSHHPAVHLLVRQNPPIGGVEAPLRPARTVIPQRAFEAEAFQQADAIASQRDTRADLSELTCLLIDLDVDPPVTQRARSRQASDPSTYDRHL